MITKPIIEVRWDWLAKIDQQIRQRQWKAAQYSREHLREILCPGRRFKLLYQHPSDHRWRLHGPCVVEWLTPTWVYYRHLEMDTPGRRGQRWNRRMPWTQVIQDLKADRFRWLNSSKTATQPRAQNRTSGTTPSTS